MQPIFPTILMENDNIVGEGLRLILLNTPFLPQYCDSKHDNLESLSEHQPALFIIVVGRESKVSVSDQITRIRGLYGSARIVILADESQRELLPDVIELGANAALLTSISSESLIKTLHALMSDNMVIVNADLWPTPSTNCAGANQGAGLNVELSEKEPRQLSSREIAILDRIVEGDSNKHIARHFNIAEATVKAHVKAILRKIGVTNRTQAAIWSMNNKPTKLFDDIETMNENEVSEEGLRAANFKLGHKPVTFEATDTI